MKTRPKKPIEVGLIGCGPRALWYGAIFADIDPNIYAQLDPAAYHHMTYCYNVDLQIRRAEGFRLAKVYDPAIRAARITASAFSHSPEVCQRIENVSEGVDLVFIANDSADGSGHYALAEPGLSKGIPTFIDRPFAATVKDAKATISLARRKHAPLFSSSHLGLLPHAAWFKSRLSEIPPAETGVVLGHGPNPAHIADGVSLAHFLFSGDLGGRARSVRSMGGWPLEIVLIHYAKPGTQRDLRVLAVNSQAPTPRHIFSAKAISLSNHVDSPDFDAFAQAEGGLAVMEALRTMVATGKPPAPYSELIEPVAIMEAGRKAHNNPHPAPVRVS